MNFRSHATMALTLAILLPAPASASPKAAAAVALRTHEERSSDLYSLRARRRARKILEMELYELRLHRFEAVRKVILRRLPPDSLTRMP